MSEVVIYTTATCPFCVRAKSLLDKKGVSYEELRVDKNPDLWKEIEERTGRNTVPQLFIGDFHVGGYDDMVDMDMDGELDPRLGIA
jgi:glutaredoxin 3